MISSGIEKIPIVPNTTPAANRLGIIPIMDKYKERKRIKNIIKIMLKTITIVPICESNKLCNILL